MSTETFPAQNVQTPARDPTEEFSIIWIWTPLVAAIFLAAPWLLYQAWAFVRRCLIRALTGFGVAFVSCMAFSLQLWSIVQAPARDALRQLGIEPPDLVALRSPK